MSKNGIPSFVAGCVLAGSAFVGIQATADVSLFEWGISTDGVITGVGDPLPVGSIFDTATGLGTVHLDFTGTGLHSGVLYVDHELSEVLNTFFKELGSVAGVPTAGQTWEIDEPRFSAVPGNIFDHFLADALDNSVGKPGPDDVAMAMGFSFILGPSETAAVDFWLSEVQPLGGFYLTQADPDSNEAVYFTGALSIQGGVPPPPPPPPAIPEAGSVLGGGALAVLAAASLWTRRIRRQACR